MNINTTILWSIFPLVLTCCSSSGVLPSNTTKLIAHHTVLKPGQELTFENPNGQGKIYYVSDFVRQYEVNNVLYKVKLTQRTKEFRHQNGIYNPGELWGSITTNDKYFERFVVEESQVEFSSLDECLRFLKEGAEYLKWVGNDQGIVLGFDISPGRDQVGISLYQMRINGKLLKSVPEKYKYSGHVQLKQANNNPSNDNVSEAVTAPDYPSAFTDPSDSDKVPRM